MMQLDEAILREHYAHLADRPSSPHPEVDDGNPPVIVMVLKGNGFRSAVYAALPAHKLPQSRAGNYPRRLR